MAVAFRGPFCLPSCCGEVRSKWERRGLCQKPIASVTAFNNELEESWVDYGVVARPICAQSLPSIRSWEEWVDHAEVGKFSTWCLRQNVVGGHEIITQII